MLTLKAPLKDFCFSSPESFTALMEACVGHLQNGCLSAGLRLLQAELDMSVHSVQRCVSRAPTPLDYVALHHCQSPSAASSNKTSSLAAGGVRPAHTQTTRAPKTNKTRDACLLEDCTTLDSASNSSAPALGSTANPPPLLVPQPKHLH